MTELTIDPVTPSTLYAAGGFKSTDAGGTWREMSVSSLRCIVVDPVVTTTLHALSGRGVVKSTDAGGTWSAVLNLPDPTLMLVSLGISPTAPAVLYAGARSDSFPSSKMGVYKSTDSGDTWTRSGLNWIEVRELVVHPTNPTTVYAVGDQRVFKTTDSGATWKAADAGLPSFPSIPYGVGVNDLAIDPVTPSTLYVGAWSGVFKSTDSAGTWIALPLTEHVDALAIDPTTPAVIYAGFHPGGVSKSTDSGATWTLLDARLRDVWPLVVDPVNGATVYAANTYRGLLKSTNAGVSWNPTHTGMPARYPTPLALDTTTSPGTVYVDTYFGLFKSTDLGVTWNACQSPESSDFGFGVSALVIDPMSSGVFYAGHLQGGIFKSTDAGGSWSLLDATSDMVNGLVIDPLVPANLYAGTRGSGVLKSTDSGQTWVAVNEGLPGLPGPQASFGAYALTIAPSNPSVLYVSTNNFDGELGLFRSTDSGASWTKAMGGIAGFFVTDMVVHPTLPSTLYAGTGGGGVFKTTDSGESWVHASTGLANPYYASLVMDPSDPSTLYAGTWGAGVFKTTNAGSTWAPVNLGLPPGSRIQGLVLDPAGQTTLYAGRLEGGVWQATPPPPAFSKGDFNGNALPDLVFRSVVDGARNKVWLMDGVDRISEVLITPDAESADWTIRGVDDFNSDGQNDLVFRSQATGGVEFWLMNGTNRVGAPVPLNGPVLNADWDLSATADFDRDGGPDLVWRNSMSQKIVIWNMDGITKVGGFSPAPDQAVNANWEIVSALDYNGDGHADLLWYNGTSGKVVTWYMQFGTRTSGQFTSPAAAGDSNWKVVASADLSGVSVAPLGSPDIVWRNETSGSQVVWHMDFGSTRMHGEFTSPAANTPALDWTIVGPR